MYPVFPASPQPPAPCHLADPEDRNIVRFVHHKWKEGWRLTGAAIQFVTLGCSSAFDKTTFVFFRIFNWIFPSLGPSLENVLLRIRNIWQSIQHGWEQEKARKEREELLVKNYELALKAKAYDGLVQDNRQLSEALNTLNEQNRELRRAQEATQNLADHAVRQRQNAVDLGEQVERYRNLVLQQNTNLQDENKRLKEQCELAQQACRKMLALHVGLKVELGDAQRQIWEMRRSGPDRIEMFARLDGIATAAQARSLDDPSSELDDGLVLLLPLLVKQIEEAGNQLQEGRRSLPADHTVAMVALQSAGRVLDDIRHYLERIPLCLRLHKSWESPVRELVDFKPGYEEV